VSDASAKPGPAAEVFERCVSAGGVALFPADTVYGLACDPGNRMAVARLYLLKRRAPSKASAVMFFDVELALRALPELGERTGAALRRLLPGGVTVLVPNPAARFPLACGEDPATLGLRVPRVALLAGVGRPVLQSSANRAGGPDPRRLDEVPTLIAETVDLVLDGGELPGTPSTVVDLRDFEASGSWSIVRAGAVGRDEVAAALDWQFQFDPSTYGDMIRAEVPAYERLQELVASSSGTGARRILELGIGTGETARRLLARHADAQLVGIDSSPGMLEVARVTLPAARVQLRAQALEDPLPDGPFDLVASALSVHHLAGDQKLALFGRVRSVLAADGRFVLADVVVPVDPQDARTPLTRGFDHPSTVEEQLHWLAAAGFEATVAWTEGDLAVIVADVART
jgi:L-threonylcarbamoyladenylate synthase